MRVGPSQVDRCSRGSWGEGKEDRGGGRKSSNTAEGTPDSRNPETAIKVMTVPRDWHGVGAPGHLCLPSFCPWGRIPQALGLQGHLAPPHASDGLSWSKGPRERGRVNRKLSSKHTVQGPRTFRPRGGPGHATARGKQAGLPHAMASHISRAGWVAHLPAKMLALRAGRISRDRTMEPKRSIANAKPAAPWLRTCAAGTAQRPRD